MSKFLIALLALDIGISLSKVYIFTWKTNYLENKVICFALVNSFSSEIIVSLSTIRNKVSNLSC